MTTASIFRRASTVAALAAAALAATACGSDFLVEDPPDIIVADNLYTDPAGFEAGLNALYAEVRREREGRSGNNELSAEPWVIGVDNGWGNFISTSERVFTEWGANTHSQQDVFYDTWTWMYQTINAANTIINRAANPDIAWTPEERDRVIGEARLFRAWAYRILTYMWGPVPLVLEESNGTTIRTDWERAPVADVRAQMEEDLLFAEAHLPEVTTDASRLSKAVAQHYLAELYLAMDRPAEAQAKAEAVINSGKYQLITERYGVQATQPGVPFMDQFLDGNVNRDEGNTEALWVLQWEQNVAGGGSNIMRRYWTNRYYNIRGLAVSAENGGRGIGRLAPTQWALDLYEPGDDRGSAFAIRKYYIYNAATIPSGHERGDTLWLTSHPEEASDETFPTTRKWEWVDPLNVSGDPQYNDQPYIRLAETYLLLAEAQFRQNDLAGAAATLNVVRRRAHASEIDAGDVTLAFILDERSRELLTEEQRRFTLLRTHTWYDRTRAFNGRSGALITPRDTIFPIPQAVIDANIGAPMPQNPGY
ncbi:MAG TPA: RagB/SusD family nutrient uptake outer membrane protein [Gemmatimonadaceae bacterium]|nr:RagB/SusD family nutrient uptake outer membrane protein [Gemmatimonadaceae bacterium]